MTHADQPARLFAVTLAYGAAWNASQPLEGQQTWDEHASFMDALVLDARARMISNATRHAIICSSRPRFQSDSFEQVAVELAAQGGTCCVERKAADGRPAISRIDDFPCSS